MFLCSNRYQLYNDQIIIKKKQVEIILDPAISAGVGAVATL